MSRPPTGTQSPHPQEREKLDNTIHTVVSAQDDSVNERILHELRQLISIQATHLTDDSASKVQALWTFILQFLGVTVGVLFGVFAALAWRKAIDAGVQADEANAMSSKANDLSEVANFMAIAAYCQSQSSADSLCSAVQSAASSKVSVYASSFYSITPAPTTSGGPSTTSKSPGATVTPGATHSGSHANSGTIAGIVIGSVFGASAIAFAQYYIYKQKSKSRNAIKKLVNMPVDNKSRLLG